MDLGIKDRVGIVTGGSRGLGRVSALSLAREGVKVAICGRTQSTLDKTVDELKSMGVAAVGIVADIAELPSAQLVYERTEAELGPVDIVVNNVGGRRGSTMTATSDEEFKAGFELNLFAALRLMRLAIPGMVARGWGRIINVGLHLGQGVRGRGGLHGRQGRPHRRQQVRRYRAGQGQCAGEQHRSRLDPASRERFSNEQPAEVVQEFISRNLPAGRFGWPEPVGDIVAFLASERASMVSGACINVDAGQSKSLI